MYGKNIRIKFYKEDRKAILYAQKESGYVRFHLEVDGRVFGEQFATPENFDEMIKREKWLEIKDTEKRWY